MDTAQASEHAAVLAAWRFPWEPVIVFTQMAHDVFISYAQEDKPVADAVCALLESKRVRCWIAPRDVLAGQEYAEAIAK